MTSRRQAEHMRPDEIQRAMEPCWITKLGDLTSEMAAQTRD